MMTIKTNKSVYWTLVAIGVGITLVAMFFVFNNPDNNWCIVAIPTGVAITLLGMLFEPITQKALENGTAGNKFYLTVFFSIVVMFSYFDIKVENRTLPIIIISVINFISLIVLCWLAYKKKRHVKLLEHELENEKNEV